MITFFFIVGLLIVVGVGESKEEVKDPLAPLAESYVKCLTKYGLSVFFPEAVLKGGLVLTSETQACFTQCLLENLNLVKSDMNGDVIPFNAFKIFNIVISITLPQVGNITNDCVDKASTGGNVCGKSAKTLHCIVNTLITNGVDGK